MKTLILGLGLLISGLSWSSTIQMINALGSSPKGQYVAIEEYGYNSNQKTYYSRIKVMNVWKNHYVTEPVEIEKGARRPSDLVQVRKEALEQAGMDLARFKIDLSG